MGVSGVVEKAPRKEPHCSVLDSPTAGPSVSLREVEPADETLLTAAGRGDQEAFARLVDRHHRDIVRFVARFVGTGDREAAEDLAQEVFISAWQAAPRFRPKATVRAWLLRIATNKGLNHQRDRRLRLVEPLEAEHRPEPAAPAGDQPEAVVLGRDAAARVQRAMRELPPQQRAALLLRHYHDLPYSEIAEALETSVSAVESLLFRARRTLAAQLRAAESEPAQVRRRRGVEKG